MFCADIYAFCRAYVVLKFVNDGIVHYASNALTVHRPACFEKVISVRMCQAFIRLKGVLHLRPR